MSTDNPRRVSRYRRKAKNACCLMSHFSSERPTITVQEFGQLLNLSSATVEELADHLVRVGCLTRDTSGAYALADNGSGVHYVELSNATVVLLTVAAQDDQPWSSPALPGVTAKQFGADMASRTRCFAARMASTGL